MFLASVGVYFWTGLTTALSIGIACAVLSVFVVSRRWAFIGEGISHSGFGGAGTVWLLASFLPGIDGVLWAPYAGVVVFSVVTACAIAYFTRRGRINSDAVIGIFLAASLAWGILAQQLYVRARHRNPAGWDVFLFGHMADVSPQFAASATVLCAGVLAAVAMLGKEVLAYCFDPATAEASGVRVGLVHYLLLVLIAMTIVIGVRVAGSVLVPALLVLPGTTALLLGGNIRAIVVVSVLVAVIATGIGIAANRIWGFLPTGPVIVLSLFAQFVVTYGLKRVRGAR